MADGVNDQKVLGQDEAAPKSQSETEKSAAASEFSRTEANGQLSMRVKVHSPFRIYFDSQAFSVSAVNPTGPFDILPKHHNFISLLSPCELVVRGVEGGPKGGEQKIRISGGIMHVKADRVIVFLDV